MLTFKELLVKTRNGGKLPERLLCLDPGETTGWAIFEQGILVRHGQTRTVCDGEIQWTQLRLLFKEIKPTHVVCEDYRIYAHKLTTHTFSPVVTLRLIGGIELLTSIESQPIHYQMATAAKMFSTDEKLKLWGFWQPSMRHARDAIRHGCYFLLFHNRGGDIV